MSDPTPFAVLVDADTALVLDDPLGPGEDVTLVDAAGGEHPLRALYEAPGLDVTPGTANAPVLSTAPVLHMQVSRVTAAIGRQLSTRDGFVVRGKAYRVMRPAEDGYGMLTCRLLEKGDA
jgi:hypothetical protein